MKNAKPNVNNFSILEMEDESYTANRERESVENTLKPYHGIS